jgi:hypothetical protein
MARTPSSASSMSKQAIVLFRPCLSGVRGDHARSSWALERSGRRCRGSSCGFGRCTILACEPVISTISSDVCTSRRRVHPATHRHRPLRAPGAVAADVCVSGTGSGSARPIAECARSAVLIWRHDFSLRRAYARLPDYNIPECNIARSISGLTEDAPASAASCSSR